MTHYLLSLFKRDSICLLLLSILVSCGNTSNEEANHQDTINQKVADPDQEKPNKTVELLIPEEINIKINQTVVFAFADIGTWDGDYIGNTLYVLYETGNIKRISNMELPELGKLFCTELIDYHKADSLKYDAFFNYLLNLTDLRYNNEFTTPDDLDVSGGSLYYVYINVEEPGFWISFEPESSNLIPKIQEEFDKLFMN